MIVGWIKATSGGFRVYESQDRRFFNCRPEGRMRREYALRQAMLRRVIGFYNHRHWRIAEKHLAGHHVRVRIWSPETDGVA